MNLEALGNIGEFIGSVAVLITLIYLAIQVRQTRNTVQSSSWQSGVNSIIDWNFRLAEDPELLDIFQRGMPNPESLDDSERLRLSLIIASFMQQFHKWYLDDEQGLVHKKAWQGESDSMVALMSQPGAQMWWETFIVPYTPEFRAYVEERVRKCETTARYQIQKPFGNF